MKHRCRQKTGGKTDKDRKWKVKHDTQVYHLQIKQIPQIPNHWVVCLSTASHHLMGEQQVIQLLVWSHLRLLMTGICFPQLVFSEEVQASAEWGLVRRDPFQQLDRKWEINELKIPWLRYPTTHPPKRRAVDFCATVSLLYQHVWLRCWTTED